MGYPVRSLLAAPELTEIIDADFEEVPSLDPHRLLLPAPAPQLPSPEEPSDRP